jgi:hypothetical protein
MRGKECFSTPEKPRALAPASPYLRPSLLAGEHKQTPTPAPQLQKSTVGPLLEGYGLPRRSEH